MRVKPIDLIIDESDPFRNDLLDRSDFVRNILSLYQSLNESLIISLSGKYGSGKTTLLEMLSAEAKKNGFVTVLFNAWQYDYLEDPLSVLFAEITRIFPTENKNTIKLKEIGKTILTIGIPAVIKAATFNLLDLSKATEEVIAGISSELASQQLKRPLELKSCITEFKETLGAAADQVGESEKKILIVVDELDRCRPDFAIKTLEAVKHLFEVPNVNFLFGLDQNQLCQSISHVYGLGTDVPGYLRRFFDLQFTIPDPDMLKFTQHLFNSYDYSDVIKERTKYRGNEEDSTQFIKTLADLAGFFGASLRDLEKCFAMFSIVLRVTPKSEYIFPAVLAFLILLYMFDNRTYSAIIQYQMDLEQIVQYFGKWEGGENFLFDLSANTGAVLFCKLAVTIEDPKKGGNAYDYFDRIAGDKDQDPNRVKVVKRMKKFAQDYRSGRNMGDVMTHIDRKIRFLDNFIE